MTAEWQRVAGGLRQAVRDGQYAPGGVLPPMPELAERYGVHVLTVRRAMTGLASEGLAVSDGRRWRVREHKPVIVHVTRRAATRDGLATAGADSFQADLEAAGRVPGQSLSVRVEPASPAVAWRLREPEGADVAVRELFRTADGEPFSLTRFAFPMAVAAGTQLMGSADIPEGSVAYLGKLGHEPVRFPVEIETRMPSAHEAAVLNIPPGVPVARVYRTGLDAGESPVSVEEAVWPGDRALLALEVE